MCDALITFNHFLNVAHHYFHVIQTVTHFFFRQGCLAVSQQGIVQIAHHLFTLVLHKLTAQLSQRIT